MKEVIPTFCSFLYEIRALSPRAPGSTYEKCFTQSVFWFHYNHCYYGILPQFCPGVSQLALLDLGCNEKAVLSGKITGVLF